jgi:hypothetical protein
MFSLRGAGRGVATPPRHSGAHIANLIPNRLIRKLPHFVTPSQSNRPYYETKDSFNALGAPHDDLRWMYPGYATHTGTYQFR